MFNQVQGATAVRHQQVNLSRTTVLPIEKSRKQDSIPKVYYTLGIMRYTIPNTLATVKKIIYAFFLFLTMNLLLQYFFFIVAINEVLFRLL